MTDEVLGVRFEANLQPLANALNEAGRRQTQWEGETERQLGRTGQRFSGFGATAVGALKGLVTGLATVAGAQGLGRLAASAAQIDTLAEAAGLTTRRYQELEIAARQAGGTFGQFDSAAKKFAESIGGVRARTGDFYNFLKQQLPSVLQQIEATRSQSEAFDVIAEAVRRLDSAESRALLSTKAFGEGARALTLAMKDGAAGLEVSAERAERYGQVVSEKAVKANKELVTSFTSLRDSVVGEFQELLGSAAPNLTKFFDFVRDRAYGTANDISKIKADAASIPDFKTTVTRERDDSPLTLQPKADFRGVDQLLSLQQQLASARGNTFQSIALEAKQAGEALTRLYADGGLSAAQYEQARGTLAATTETKITEARRATESTLAGLRVAALTAQGEQFEAIRLEYEQDLASYQRLLEQKRITDAQYQAAREQLNAVASAKIKQQIESENAEARARLSEIESAIEGNISNALSEAFRTGKLDGKAFFTSLLADIALATTRMLVLKPLIDGLFGGPGGGIIGSAIGPALTGPARAEGGAVLAGVPYRINERMGRKPEMFVPSQNGRIIPGERASGGGGGGASSVYNIDARGADIGVAERVERALVAIEARRKDPVAAVGQFQRRYPGRAA